jgi:hypothetical protein
VRISRLTFDTDIVARARIGSLAARRALAQLAIIGAANTGNVGLFQGNRVLLQHVERDVRVKV